MPKILTKEEKLLSKLIRKEKQKEYNKKWRIKNPEKNKEKNRKQNLKRKKLLQNDEYRQKRKEYLKEWRKKYGKEYNKKYRQENPDRYQKYDKRSWFKKKYKITLEQLNEMKLKQSNKCFICYIEKPLCLDHNHTTNKIRKLLCNTCNAAIGFIKEDINIAKKIIKYLETEGDSVC